MIHTQDQKEVKDETVAPDETSEVTFPELTKHVLESCSFQTWYPAFESYTFKSTIIPLSPEVLQYLGDDLDGFFLPLDENEQQYRSQLSDSDESASSYDDEAVSKPGTSTHSLSASDPKIQTTSSRCRKKYDFTELNHIIRNAIHLHDGSVFPKLNWSAPQDSAFMLPSGDGLLRCRCPNDIYTLLKTSDCIAHDLNLVKERYCDSTFPFVLVLREWFNLNPAHEFRCFVRHRSLIAISSRSSTHFDFLQPVEVQEAIISRISSFYQSVIVPKFTLSDYSFDVYITNPTRIIPPKGKPSPKLKLLDFNPLSCYSEPYLFSFEELLVPSERLKQKPELRLVKEAGLQPSRFASSHLPLDILSCSQGQQISDLSDKWSQLLARGCTDSDSEDSDGCE
ncbi:D123-domain-containing protein [Melampsora americana]|nr:D123-domain-containing protein [Melampsora americana]